MTVRHFAVSLVAAVVLNAGAAYADSFEDGLAAAKRGDIATALSLWRPLADKGHADAQSNLGAMYYNGQGVAKDYVRALMWWNVAAARGYADAARNRDTFSKRMTPQQIAQAREMAQRCVASKYKQCE